MDQQQEQSERPSLGDRTRDFTSQAQQKAGEQVRSGVDSGRRRAASTLSGVADSLLHGSGEQADGASRYIREAGEQVQRAADWLEQADVDEITQRAEQFARRQPAIFIGGAFALGLIAARFLKSSRRAQLADAPGDLHNDDDHWHGETFHAADGLTSSGAGASGYGMTGSESTAGWSDRGANHPSSLSHTAPGGTPSGSTPGGSTPFGGTSGEVRRDR